MRERKNVQRSNGSAACRGVARPVVVSVLIFSAGMLMACEGESSPAVVSAPAALPDPAEEAPSGGVAADEPSVDTEPGLGRIPANSEAAALDAGETADPQPRIRFERVFHEYGSIWDVGRYATDFRFTNTGDAPLNILAVRAGCGCTTTGLRTTIYDPGEGGTIDLVFTPQGMGRQVKTVTVVTDDPDAPTIELSIGATIQEFAVAEPRLLRFGTVPLGESRSRRLLIRSADPEATITGVSVGGINPGAVAARLLPGETQLGNRSGIGVVEVIVHERNPWGAVYASVEVTTQGRTPDGESIEHVTRVATAASIFGSVHASDNMVRVEIVPPGGSFERTLRVHAPDGLPFMLSGEAESRSFPMTVEILPAPVAAPDSAYDVFVRGDVGTYMGLIRGTLILRTDVPGEEELRMSIQGIVREP